MINDEKSRAWWRRQLSGNLIATEIPLSNNRPAVYAFNRANISKKITAGIYNRIKKMAAATGFDEYTLLLSAFHILLLRYCRQQEIIVGSVFADNPVVLRTVFATDDTLEQCITKVDATVKNARQYHSLPFNELLQDLGIDFSMNRAPLFQIAVIMEGQSTPIAAAAGILNLCDFVLIFSEQNGLCLSGEFDTDLYSESLIQRILNNFAVILTGLTDNLALRYSELAILAADEMQQIQAWSQIAQTPEIPPEYLPIHELFEKSAKAFPGAEALIYNEQRLTYRQLNESANQLAHYIKTLDIKPIGAVAICLDRSPLLIIALLAVLKTGGFYIALDPAYPQKRNQHIVSDSQVSLILTMTQYQQPFLAEGLRVVALDQNPSQWRQQSHQNLNNPIAAEALAYVLYTSGSTGAPKGIAITHQNGANLLTWGAATYDALELQGVLAGTSICFDLAVFEIFLPLAVGGKIILVDDPTDMARLNPRILTEISLINTVPSVISALLDSHHIPDSVITVNLAGEPLTKTIVERLYRIPSIQKVYNLYGPSETTTYATAALIGREESHPPLIGKPLANTLILLLDDHQRPAPLGAAGEIYIGGYSIAQGYYRNSLKTREKFLKLDPDLGRDFIFFKTNDLACYSESGNLRFLGRIDNQIKLRGFRIELEEIEAVLVAHPAIKQAVVVVDNQHSPLHNLTAFIVLKANHYLRPEQLKNYLRSFLPKYMEPAVYHFVDHLLLNENGKIDRKKMLSQQVDHSIENQISLIWRELLHIPALNLNDNFFDLGGHSLLLMQMQQRLQTQFNIQINKSELFKYPTVKELALFIRQSTQPPLAENEKILCSAGENALSTKIAVIGMSCRFPGAENLEQFWQNLCQGVESIEELSDQDLQASADDLHNPYYVKKAAWIADIEFFDYELFNYSPKEAILLDPQQRIFLECVWEAFEQAGYSPLHHPESVGVFTAMEKSEYLDTVLNPGLNSAGAISNAEKFLVRISNDKDYLPTRIAYKFNCKGPGVNVQTACSSSLVAIHYARQSLLNGECEMAIAGGVTLHIPQKTGYLYQEGMILSPDGHCRAFDEQAQGTVLGNGAGVVLLKRLDQALADKDTVYAILTGSAVNNDGSQKMGYTAPSIAGQSEVIRKAQQSAQVSPESISYIEAHGTGTSLGDPIEIAALSQVFSGVNTRCGLGSVKTNIGHLDSAAGVAGFIKTVLSLKHGVLPPTLHFSKLNPEIDFGDTGFYICDQLQAWPQQTFQRRAGVSSFGIGGTNAHVILEEAPAQQLDRVDALPAILPLSAMNEASLKILAKRYLEFFSAAPFNLNLTDVCYTAAIGRVHFPCRIIFTGRDREHFIAQLTAWLGGKFFPLAETLPLPDIVHTYLQGAAVDWQAYYQNAQCRRVALPTYPFQRKYCWFESSLSPLGHQLKLPFTHQIRFENQFSIRSPSYNAHHRLFGTVVVPGSSHLAMFIAALDKIHSVEHCCLREIFFLKPFILEDQAVRTVQIIVDVSKQSPTIKIVSADPSANQHSDDHWVVHAQAQWSRQEPLARKFDLTRIKQRCHLSRSGEDFYTRVWAPGLDTGPCFRWIKHIWYNDAGEALGETAQPVTVADLAMPLHPGLLETGFQLLNACWKFKTEDLLSQEIIYVPFSIESLTFRKNFPAQHLLSYAKIRNQNNEQNLIADVFLFKPNGETVVEIIGFEVRKLHKATVKNVYKIDWAPAALAWENKVDHHHSEAGLLRQKDLSQVVIAPADWLTPVNEPPPSLPHYIKSVVAEILQIHYDSLDTHRGFVDMGMDSLMSLDFRSRLQQDLKLNLSATFAFDFPNIEKVVEYLQEQLKLELTIEDEYQKLKLML